MTYVAAPALSASAYVSVTKSTDIIFFGLLFFAVTAELLVVTLFLVNNYFRAQFTPHYWFGVFCLSALTFPLITYERTRSGDFVYVWVIMQLSVVTGMALIYSAHTIALVVNGKWFRSWPKPESPGALSFFQRLSHDAFRAAGKRLLEMNPKLLDEVSSSSNGPEKASPRPEYLELLDGYLHALEVHSNYEDTVIFPQVDVYVPAKRKKIAEVRGSLLPCFAVVSSFFCTLRCPCIQNLIHMYAM